MTSMVEKILRVALVATVFLGVLAIPTLAVAQDAAPGEQEGAVEKEAPPAETNAWKSLVAIGAGITTIGGAIGIGRLAAAAMEGTARQPEAGGDIRTSMIIAAALIEGFTFFALIVCFLSI